MAAKPQPTARRIELGHDLRQLRREVGLTMAQAVRGMPFDESTLQRVETGWKSFRQASHLRKLLDRYGVTDEEEVERLLAMQRESASREWWTGVPNTDMLSGMRRFLGVQAAAREIRVFHPIIVPGLFQTEEYAWALHDLRKPIDETTTEFEQKSVALRMKRKETITDREDDPPRIWAILHESALRYAVGGAEVMREQYAELGRLAALEHVTMQVLPLGGSGFVAPFHINIMVLGEGLPTTVQTDTVWRSVAVADKPREVGRFSRMFDAMAAGALPPGDTPKFLTRLVKEIEEE